MTLLLFCLAYYLAAGLAVNLTYHRALAHQSLKLDKGLERFLATLGLPAGTPVQWVGNHRAHHAHADSPKDPHSPHQGGFWHAHVGWYIGSKNTLVCFLYSVAGPLRTLIDGWIRPRTNQQYNRLAGNIESDPYYRWISRPRPYLAACWLHVLVTFGTAYVLARGWGVAALWLTSILVYNVGDSVDSFAHLYGEKSHDTANQARDNGLIGFLALGEGWHAQHHEFPASARHGLGPFQFDWTWQVIRILECLGLAKDVQCPLSGAQKQNPAEFPLRSNDGTPNDF